MIYFLNLLYSTIYFFLIKTSKKINLINCIPVIIVWTIIIGGQYGVGTDYFSYLQIFYNVDSLELYSRKKEYIFYYLVKILTNFFEDGQILFLTIGLIENIFFIQLLKKMLKMKILEKKYIYIFVFIFLAYGTNFYNQMNGLRQYFNIYIFVLIILLAIEKKYLLYNIYSAIALNIHRSFFLIYPFYIIYKIFRKRITKKILIISLLIVVVINFINLEKYIKILSLYIPRYSHYMDSNYFNSISIKGKILKLIYIPFIYESILLLKKVKVPMQKEFLKIGIISYIIKTACLITSVTNRVGEYFTLLGLFPIYYLIINYIQEKKKVKLLLLVFLITVIFITKVFLLATKEYAYKFYLFQ